MDPFTQAVLTLLTGLGVLVFLVVFVTPVLDRLADRWERRGRHLPPAE